MNELGETTGFSSQKKGGLDKGIIVNIVFISIAVLVIGLASSVFFGVFSEGKFSSTSPNGSTYSNFKGEEQYYDGEENWNLNYSNQNENEESSDVQQIENATYEDLKNGFRTRILEGGVLRFDYDGEAHEMIIDSVNSDSVDVTVQSQAIFSSIDLEDYEMFDLNGDFVYDLKVSLLEIVSNEGIFDVSAVSEKYIPSAENVPEDVDNFTIYTIERPPFSCTEKDGYVDYSYLIISKADGKTYDEKKVDQVKEDVCVGLEDHYRKYYCDGKDFNFTYVYCNSRFESCSDATCVKTKYERSLTDSENAEQNYTGDSECIVKLDSNTFWFSSSLENCEDIYLASRVFSRSVFFDYMTYEGLYYPVFRAYFTNPQDLEFYYLNSSGETINLTYVSDLVESETCESFSFLGLDTNCLNSIPGKKDNNLEYFFYLIKFFSDSNYDYDSDFIIGNTFDFLKSKVSTYIDSSDSSSITGSGCTGGIYASYNNQNFYICEEAINNVADEGNKANVMIDGFFDLLGTLTGYNEEECFDVVIDTSYWIVYYGDYDGQTETESRPDWDGLCACTCSDPEGCYDAICDGCRAYDKSIEQNETYEFLNMDNILGEKLNFLYKMYKNNKILYSERAIFNTEAESLFNSISCSNGIYNQNFNFNGETILEPEVLPEKYITP